MEIQYSPTLLGENNSELFCSCNRNSILNPEVMRALFKSHADKCASNIKEIDKIVHLRSLFIEIVSNNLIILISESLFLS